MEMQELPISLYVIRSEQSGKWMRSKGFPSTGKKWVDDIKNAKIYFKKSIARAQITWFTTHYPEIPPPNLIELICTEIKIDPNESLRAYGAMHKIEINKIRKKINKIEHLISELEKDKNSNEEKLKKEFENLTHLNQVLIDITT